MEKLNFNKQDILDRITFLRTEKKMSAYKLGLELGHSKTYIYRIESGEIQLTLETFLEILEVLGVTTSEFFCPFSSKKEPLADLLKGLSKDNKEILIELISRMKK